MPKFLRRTSNLHSRLGRKRKNKQVWRKPTGRDNKMRERKKGLPKVISVGYKKDRRDRGRIEGKSVVRVSNIKDLTGLKKDVSIILNNVGMKKRIEIAKYAKEKGIKIINVNTKKILKNKDKKEIKTEKMTGEEARKIIDKKKEDKVQEKSK